MQQDSPDDTKSSGSQEESARQASPEHGAVAREVAQVTVAAGDTDRLVSRIWQEVLHVERIEPQDSFFALGGSSLLAVQVTARIRHAMGVEIAIRELFRSPGLAQFARVVDEHRVRAIERALRGADGSGIDLLERVRGMSEAEVAALSKQLKGAE